MIPANTPLLYEVELIDIEDKIDVKEGFKSIDLDGDKHITLEEVSNIPPPPRKNNPTKQTKSNPYKKTAIELHLTQAFSKKGKKSKKEF